MVAQTRDRLRAQTLGARAWAFALLAALVLLGAACAAGSSPATQTLAEWTVAVPPARGQAVTLPAQLGPLVGDAPVYVLSARVLVDPALRRGPVTLVLASAPGLASLRVDGREIPSLDAPLTDRYRASGPHRWRLPDDAVADGWLDLELRVENTWTQAVWIGTAPRLSATPAGDRELLAVSAFNALTSLGCVPMLGILILIYLALYVSDRSQPQSLWFALEGVGAIGYPAMMAGITQPLLGRAEVAVIGTAFAFSAVATVHFSHAYLRLPRPSVLWWVALGAVAVVAVACGGPFAATRWVVPGAMALIGANAAYHVVLLVRLLWRRRPPSNAFIVTLSWPVGLAVGTSDVAGWLGLGDPFHGLRSGSLGIAFVAALQSVALAREHAKSRREITLLNDELQRQVAARSRQLADALARLGTAPRRPVELTPGDEVEGRYRVVKLLGQGASGRVYEVERAADGKPFAMKVMLPHRDPFSLARAAREAQLASEVRHPNVVSIVDVDVSSDGYFFLVMELIEGHSLRDERPRFGDVGWALPILRQLAEGLAAIHARGIVHRDLKPANVLLAGPAHDYAKIADFGISALAPSGDPVAPRPRADSDVSTLVDPRTPSSDGASITATGDVLGTPHYMAPESVQAGAKAAQAPADVFAFGVVAFEMLTGKRPFGSMPAFLGVAMQSGSKAVLPMATAIPAFAAEVLSRCLARDPRERPTALEIAGVLSR